MGWKSRDKKPANTLTKQSKNWLHMQKLWSIKRVANVQEIKTCGSWNLPLKLDLQVYPTALEFSLPFSTHGFSKTCLDMSPNQRAVTFARNSITLLETLKRRWPGISWQKYFPIAIENEHISSLQELIMKKMMVNARWLCLLRCHNWLYREKLAKEKFILAFRVKLIKVYFCSYYGEFVL